MLADEACSHEPLHRSTFDRNYKLRLTVPTRIGTAFYFHACTSPMARAAFKIVVTWPNAKAEQTPLLEQLFTTGTMHCHQLRTSGICVDSRSTHGRCDTHGRCLKYDRHCCRT